MVCSAIGFVGYVECWSVVCSAIGFVGYVECWSGFQQVLEWVSVDFGVGCLGGFCSRLWGSLLIPLDFSFKT